MGTRSMGWPSRSPSAVSLACLFAAVLGRVSLKDYFWVELEGSQFSACIARTVLCRFSKWRAVSQAKELLPYSKVLEVTQAFRRLCIGHSNHLFLNTNQSELDIFSDCRGKPTRPFLFSWSCCLLFNGILRRAFV